MIQSFGQRSRLPNEQAMNAVLISLIATCAFCFSGHAATLISSLTAFSTTPSRDESLGYRFTANAPVEVTSLGYFDVNGDGLLSNHQVGLWTATGVLLAQATVLPSSPTVNGFLYAFLPTSVTLAAGSDYYIAGTTTGDTWIFDASSFAIDPAFTYVASHFAPGSPSALTFPSQSTMAREYFNVNLQANIVPEPNAATLAASGVVTLMGMYARRRTPNSRKWPNNGAAENCSGAAARVTVAAPRRPTAQPARHAPPPLRSL